MKKFWPHTEVEKLQQKIVKLQKQLVRHKAQEAARASGCHPKGEVFLADMAEEHFKSEWGDWEAGEPEKISRFQLDFFLNEAKRKARFLWPEGGEKRGSASGEAPKALVGVKSKEDFKNEQEEAQFILRHGRAAYLALPGRSRFAKVA